MVLADKKKKKNYYTEYANLSKITQTRLSVWFALVGCDVWIVIDEFLKKKKKKKVTPQIHQIDSEITGDVFTFLSHKILIYP